MNQRTLGSAVVSALVILVSSAAPAVWADAPPCPAGTARFSEYRLFFGRSGGAAEVVTEEAWRAFLATEITPRFPQGLTVLDASGQWRNPSGTIVRERTKLAVILAEPGESGMRLTDEIAQAYKRVFGQESVLRVVGPACASF